MDVNEADAIIALLMLSVTIDNDNRLNGSRMPELMLKMKYGA